MRDFMGLMKKAQEQAEAMQQKMAAMQQELESVEVEGTSGGGAVSIRVSVRGNVKAVKIDPALMNADEVEILEDLIVAAMNDARVRSERVTQERMQDITKGLPLPEGFKLPF
jgi:DNA-binding YbaB/EbfC family protein